MKKVGRDDVRRVQGPDYFEAVRSSWSARTTLANVSQADMALIRASGIFDEGWYKSTYVDVGILEADPVQHYLWIGAMLGRSPSSKFCSRSYLDANPDVKRGRLNPLIHYITHGRKENRPVYPVLTQAEKNARRSVKRMVSRRRVDWDEEAERTLINRLAGIEDRDAPSLVSVIMPTKNRAYCIEKAIRSVFAQTHSNFELIVVDDGGTDNTSEVVGAFSDARIKYIRNSKCGGVSKARNIGLKAARGEWTFFLDSDNAWRSNMIEFMLKHARQSQVSAGYSAANLLDDQGARKAVLYANFDFEACLQENFIDLNCFFVRRAGRFKDVFFDEKLRRLVDWDYILRIAAHTRVVGLPYVGVDYYDGSNARISNLEHVEGCALSELVTHIRSRAKSYLMEAETIKDAASYRLAVILHVFHADRVDECIQYLRNINSEFDLFITTSLDEGVSSIASIVEAFPRAFVCRFPNIGSDIAPFMELMSTLKNYWLVCKIHTKRDVGPWGGAWRSLLLQSVLGSTRKVNEILSRFKANRQLKLVGAKELYKHGVENSIPETLNQVKTLALKVGVGDALASDWAFVAGTMFWARPQEFLRLARHMCDSDGYSAIFRQDGALEHGLERMFGLCLWADKESQVGLVAGESIEEHPLGRGHTKEGVSVTLTRLTAVA